MDHLPATGFPTCRSADSCGGHFDEELFSALKVVPCQGGTPHYQSHQDLKQEQELAVGRQQEQAYNDCRAMLNSEVGAALPRSMQEEPDMPVDDNAPLEELRRKDRRTAEFEAVGSCAKIPRGSFSRSRQLYPPFNAGGVRYEHNDMKLNSSRILKKMMKTGGAKVKKIQRKVQSSTMRMHDCES